MRVVIGICSVLAIVGAMSQAAKAHDIYTGLRDKTQRLCCGGNDCSATTYRESGGVFEFLTREKHWIAIPSDRITFLPIPGDPPSTESHRAHICYRQPNDYDSAVSPDEDRFEGEGQIIHLYCIFVTPGSI